MLQHTSELSETHVMAKVSTTQLSKNEVVTLPISGESQPNSQTSEASEEALDFGALLKASTEEGATPQSMQTKPSAEKAVSQSLGDISELIAPSKQSNDKENMSGQLTQEIENAIFSPGGEENGLSEIVTVPSSLQNQKVASDQEGGALNTPITSMMKAEPIKDTASKIKNSNTEVNVSDAKNISIKPSQTVEEIIIDKQTAETVIPSVEMVAQTAGHTTQNTTAMAQAGEHVKNTASKIKDSDTEVNASDAKNLSKELSQTVEEITLDIQTAETFIPSVQMAGHTPQNITAMTKAGKMSNTQNNLNSLGSNLNQSDSSHETVEEETLQTSLLSKDQKIGLQNAVSGQPVNGLQPGQQPSLSAGMTADALKSQAIMEQFRQHQTVLKQQKALQIAQAKEEGLTDLGVQNIKTDSANNLTGISDKMSQLPMSYQTIPHSIHSQKWGEALGKHLIMAVSRGLQKMQITLNPEKLGPIQVRLHMDKDKQLHINLQAHHALTREAMMDAMPRLREMLESNGAQLANLDVAEHGFEQGAYAEENGRQTGKNTQNVGLNGEDEELQIIPNTQLSTLSDSMVDYYA
ncbi:flagellar hook-length control protein FliK [Galenea microaerophila]